jgi:hypothetical protein
VRQAKIQYEPSYQALLDSARSSRFFKLPCVALSYLLTFLIHVTLSLPNLD